MGWRVIVPLCFLIASVLVLTRPEAVEERKRMAEQNEQRQQVLDSRAAKQRIEQLEREDQQAHQHLRVLEPVKSKSWRAFLEEDLPRIAKQCADPAVRRNLASYCAAIDEVVAAQKKSQEAP